MSLTLGLTFIEARTSPLVPDLMTGREMLSGNILVKEGAVGLLFQVSKLLSVLCFCFDLVQ